MPTSSISLPWDDAENGDSSKSGKDRAENSVTHSPGDGCADERQGREQNKHVCGLGVHIARERMEGRTILAQRANGEKHHLKFQRRLADFFRHVGTMIRAGRVFTHLSQDQLAARAGIHGD